MEKAGEEEGEGGREREGGGKGGNGGGKGGEGEGEGGDNGLPLRQQLLLSQKASLVNLRVIVPVLGLYLHTHTTNTHTHTYTYCTGKTRCMPTVIKYRCKQELLQQMHTTNTN